MTFRGGRLPGCGAAPRCPRTPGGRSVVSTAAVPPPSRSRASSSSLLSTRERSSSYSSRQRRISGGRTTVTPSVTVSPGRNWPRVRSISKPEAQRFHQWYPVRSPSTWTSPSTRSPPSRSFTTSVVTPHWSRSGLSGAHASLDPGSAVSAPQLSRSAASMSLKRSGVMAITLAPATDNHASSQLRGVSAHTTPSATAWAIASAVVPAAPSTSRVSAPAPPHLGPHPGGRTGERHG